MPAPTLTGINPSTITAYQGGSIQLTGTNLEHVTEVRLTPIVGGMRQYTNFITQTPTTLTFAPTAPIPVLGLNFVTVVSPGGTSSSVTMTVTGNDPALMEGFNILVRGSAYTISVHSAPPNKAIVFGSFSNAPSVLPGIVNFQIGANFSQLWQLLPELTVDNTGTATGQLNVPTSIPFGTPIHFQALVFDLGNLTLPVATTANILSPSVF